MPRRTRLGDPRAKGTLSLSTPMHDKRRIPAILEEVLNSGATPEELCRDCPELLPAVRDQLQQLRAVEAELEAVFPSSAEPGSGPLPWPSAPPALPGYTIESTVGFGGMGVVYKARHLKLKRVVALKVLLAGGGAGGTRLGVTGRT